MTAPAVTQNKTVNMTRNEKEMPAKNMKLLKVKENFNKGFNAKETPTKEKKKSKETTKKMPQDTPTKQPTEGRKEKKLKKRVLDHKYQEDQEIPSKLIKNTKSLVEEKVRNLPGKKEGKPVATTKETKSNKCGICSTIFNSKKDKKYNQMFKKQNVWLGCDTTSCTYWAHARCVGVTVPAKGRRGPEKIPFNCPTHKNSDNNN